MRCSNCDYRLWNLRSRQCPECGTSFSPSDFEFIPNSIRFCCPHCDQAYYGTGPKGHLVPVEFDCGSCGRHIHMDEMVLLPTAGVEEEQTEVDRVPWLERRQRGVLRAWFSTIGMAMVNPGRLIRGVPAQADVGEAWWFAVVTNTLILLLGLAPFGFFTAGNVIAAIGGGGAGVVAGLVVGLVIGSIVAAIGTVFFIAVWGGITQAVLWATGDTAGGFPVTGQAICYSTGANALTALPCLGLYFGWIWWIISAVLMVKEAQQVQGWRAAVGVLTLPVVLISIVIGFYVGLIVMVLSSIGPLTANLAMPDEEARIATRAVVRYAKENEGRGPGHAIQLASGDYLTAMDFVSDQSGTYMSAVPVAGMTLGQFVLLSPGGQEQAARRAIDALPEGIVAHRLGDFVFTYHGIVSSDADPGLWVVVMTPDPDSNSSFSFGGEILVGRVDGTVLSVPINDLRSWLMRQNELRQEHGLFPLPDPSTVTHDRPAVSGR